MLLVAVSCEGPSWDGRRSTSLHTLTRPALVAELPVRPRPRFAAAAAAVFHGNNSLGVPLRGPVLGVHMRGTDREPCGQGGTPAVRG